MSEGEAVRGEKRRLDWESSPDLTTLPKDELALVLEQLVQQEQEISYQRRILQGRIDLIRSEFVRRGDASVSSEELARVLMDRGGPGA